MRGHRVWFSKPDGAVAERQVTQELQLLSPENSKLSYVLGAYYFHNSFGWKRLELDIPAAGIASRVESPSGTTQSYAFFAQATYPVIQDTDLTLGLTLFRGEEDGLGGR